ncbi:MAG: putative oxidoreductase [Eubacteriales bacterium]|nr:putative oxidoreductase [Eubacteriales bacterium]MDN5364395.1 putative oxidoreductase [Eubacteriales bacterium]
MRKFTKEELRYYNGQKGRPAYVAYLGRVYDVSALSKDGDHQACIPGNDLTDILRMMSYEDKVIWKFPVVDILE